MIRVPKAYPAYFGAYAEFATIRAFVDPIPNLFLVGRNGMHRYNNQDHSMLTAKAAVDNIAAGRTDKATSGTSTSTTSTTSRRAPDPRRGRMAPDK